MNYVFFFPYRGVGGVPVLFLRVAECMANSGKNVSVVDFPDGYMAQNASNKVRVIPFYSNQDIELSTDSVLIMQADLPWGIPRNFKGKDLRVFFWVCYPFNMIPVLPGKGKDWMAKSLRVSTFILRTFLRHSVSKCKRMLQLLEKNMSVAYMDRPCLATTEKYLDYSHTHVKFLPIISHRSKAARKVNVMRSEKELHCAWVGRLADFKISILNKVIQDLYKSSYETKNKVKFSIIGAGDRDKELILLGGHDYFSIEMLGSLSMELLEDYLISDVDLLFAMGTSALEGAKLGVPTVALDFSYGKINKYGYKFLYEKTGYSLAENLALSPSTDGMTMNEVVSKTLKDWDEVSEYCLNYFVDNHNVENQLSNIVEKINSSTLSYEFLIKQTFISKPHFYMVWGIIKRIKELYVQS